MRIRELAIATMGLLTLQGVAAAQVVPLDQALAQGSVTSGNGAFTFSFAAGAFQATGSLSADPATYSLNVLQDGFEILGPITLSDTETGSLQLSYAVDSTSSMDGSQLDLFGTETGAGASVDVAQELFLPGAAISFASLAVNPTAPSDGVALSALLAFDVDTSINLSTSALGETALVTFVRHTITVPEPSRQVLALAAGAALALLVRCRRAGDATQLG